LTITQFGIKFIKIPYQISGFIIMVNNIQSYYIDVLQEVAIENVHTDLIVRKLQAYSLFHQVQQFFVHHFNNNEGMNCNVLNRSNLDHTTINEGIQLITSFFGYLIENKITNLDVYPHGMYCDVTTNWIETLLGNPESTTQTNLFNVMVSPKVNWFSLKHDTNLWNQDNQYSAIALKRILDTYNDSKTMFIVRSVNEEHLFEFSDQVVSFLIAAIKANNCRSYQHSASRLVGNKIQSLQEFTHSGIHTGLINVAMNY
jgi:hypothetical protein